MKTQSPARAIPHPLPGPARRQGGYLLLEVVVGIAIASILIGAFYQVSATIAENKRLASTERGIALIAEALYNYRMQEREWPTSMADLSSYAPNMSAGLTNGFGLPYTLALTAAATDPVAPISVGTELPSAEIAENVMREFYGRGTRTGTRISVEIPIPGHEPAREALLARDGTRDMDGNLDMDLHDLVDVGEADIRTTLTAGRIGSRIEITTPVLVVDDSITLNDPVDPTAAGHQVDGADFGFLNQIGSLNCSGSERVTISGGVASCSAPPAPSTGSAGGGCSGAREGDCRCAGDLICGVYGSSGGCSCSCANQCGP